MTNVPELEGSALIEHINNLIDREDVAYSKAKDVLQRKGYEEKDFEIGGVLYGYSINELLKLARSDPT